jgi:hypothetical protein
MLIDVGGGVGNGRIREHLRDIPHRMEVSRSHRWDDSRLRDVGVVRGRTSVETEIWVFRRNSDILEVAEPCAVVKGLARPIDILSGNHMRRCDDLQRGLVFTYAHNIRLQLVGRRIPKEDPGLSAGFKLLKRLVRAMNPRQAPEASRMRELSIRAVK